jgi:hypothetical protein
VDCVPVPAHHPVSQEFFYDPLEDQVVLQLQIYQRCLLILAFSLHFQHVCLIPEKEYEYYSL